HLALAVFLSFHWQLSPLRLPSFPTRRSSDLGEAAEPPRQRVYLRLHPVHVAPRDSRQQVKRAQIVVHGAADSQPGERLKRDAARSEEHTSELQSRVDLVCRLLLEKKKNRRKV